MKFYFSKIRWNFSWMGDVISIYKLVVSGWIKKIGDRVIKSVIEFIMNIMMTMWISSICCYKIYRTFWGNAVFEYSFTIIQVFNKTKWKKIGFQFIFEKFLQQWNFETVFSHTISLKEQLYFESGLRKNDDLT